MKKAKAAFYWLVCEAYIIWRLICGDSLKIAQTRWNVRKMNKATIKATGRSMGRFYTVVDGERVTFDFGNKKTFKR